MTTTPTKAKEESLLPPKVMTKLVNNFHLYCDELDKAARDPKLKAYAKKDVIQLIHQIVKDNVLDRIQNRELKDIRNLLIDKENQNIINVTDY